VRVTVQEYAEAHGVAESTVRRWCSRGKLNAEKVQSEDQPWRSTWMIQDGDPEEQPDPREGGGESSSLEEEQEEAPAGAGETARFHVEPRGGHYQPKEALCQEREDESDSPTEPRRSWSTEDLEEKETGTGTGWILAAALAAAVVLWRSPTSGRG